ncbi:MAG: hypothetical protein V3V92_03265 [Candidatus Hydrothermarchaeales archaeon]
MNKRTKNALIILTVFAIGVLYTQWTSKPVPAETRDLSLSIEIDGTVLTIWVENIRDYEVSIKHVPNIGYSFLIELEGSGKTYKNHRMQIDPKSQSTGGYGSWQYLVLKPRQRVEYQFDLKDTVLIDENRNSLKWSPGEYSLKVLYILGHAEGEDYTVESGRMRFDVY